MGSEKRIPFRWRLPCFEQDFYTGSASWRLSKHGYFPWLEKKNMARRQNGSLTRRNFLATSAVGAAAALSAPAIVTANKSGSSTIVGEGDYRYRIKHAWPELPDKYNWQTTHNVAVDKAGNLYVIHEGQKEKADHPSIFVFDPEGRFVRAFGEQFQGGGHGIEVRQEDGQEFLYVCAYQHLKTFAKLDLKGEVVWSKFAPMESGVYAEGEASKPEKVWGRDRFLPTNFAFLPDGDFFLADGYGSFFIHRYDRHGNWKSAFGGPGDGQGKFQTPHGIWIDNRPGREPEIVIADRANHTLQYLSLEGKYITTLGGYGLPANIDTFENLMVVPELYARLTLLDENNKVVARLGDDSARIRADKKFGIRRSPHDWREGRFVHPHDACFDGEGNIFVAEWVATGRISKLERLG